MDFTNATIEPADGLHFRIDCVPPSTTSQGKRAVVTPMGVRFFKSKQGKDAERTYESLLAPFRPDQPVSGPVRLELVFVWPWRKSDLSTKAQQAARSHKDARRWHEGKPDCDNIAKQFCDCLSTLLFIGNDAKVAELHVRKFWGTSPGIEVTITPLEPAG